MYTAKDMYNVLKMKDSDKGDIIDKWLKEEVLPKRSLDDYSGGYGCPEGVTLREAERLLEMRGFSVKIHSDWQGDFICLSIPPQSK